MIVHYERGNARCVGNVAVETRIPFASSPGLSMSESLIKRDTFHDTLVPFLVPVSPQEAVCLRESRENRDEFPSVDRPRSAAIIRRFAVSTIRRSPVGERLGEK